MLRKFIAIFIFLFISHSYIYSQSNKINFLFSNSVGYDFSKSAPTFFINLSTEIDEGVFAGLRAGIYAFDKDLDEAAYDIVNPIYQSMPPNSSGYGVFPIPKQAPSYIAAFQGSYTFIKNTSVNFSFGARFYQDKIYETSISFYKPPNSNSLPLIKINLFSGANLISTKDIIKAYYSLGVDFSLNSFRLGVFADNIFSFGINIGKEF